MKIVILAINCPIFHGKTIEERGLGGSETAVTRLAEALQHLGHEVIVATRCENPPPSKPLYIHYQQGYKIGPFDVLIIMRNWMQAFVSPGLTYKKCFLWVVDAYDSPFSMGIGDPRVADKYDGMFFVSKWHAESLCEASGFPKEKAWILRNAVYLPYFQGEEMRRRKRLIFSSTPWRGLKYLPFIFSELKKKHPELELHIFNSIDRDQVEPNVKSRRFKKALNTLKEMGAVIHGSIPQKELAREFMKSAILAYPCNYLETSCITALEAMAAGCAIVTSDLGALKETIGDAGLFIEEKPGSKKYLQKFVEATDHLLSDDALFQRLSLAGLERAKSFTWERTAQSLLDYLKLLHKLG